MVGNISNYTKIDILRTFLSIDKPISRLELVGKLELGEGTIRTILDILKNKKLISSTRKGHFLTEKGKLLSKKIKKLIEIKHNLNYSFYKKPNVSILLRNKENIGFNIAHRDIAIRNGADSCLIFKFKNNRLTLPLFRMKFDTAKIRYSFNFNKNDLLIVVFSKNKRIVENAGLAVCLGISDNLRKTSMIL